MKKRKRSEAKEESAGAALVKLRWAKTTAVERRAHAMKMVEARRRNRQQQD